MNIVDALSLTHGSQLPSCCLSPSLSRDCSVNGNTSQCGCGVVGSIPTSPIYIWKKQQHQSNHLLVLVGELLTFWRAGELQSAAMASSHGGRPRAQWRFHSGSVPATTGGRLSKKRTLADVGLPASALNRKAPRAHRNVVLELESRRLLGRTCCQHPLM